MITDQQLIELHITVDKEAANAVDLIKDECNLCTSQIKQAMQKGAVWLSRKKQTRRTRRFKKNLYIDDQLHVYYDSNVLSSIPTQPKLINDQTDYSIWYKPYGVYCQGSKWGDHCTINRLVEQQTERPSFIVHRLDRATTGLIIIAHSKHSSAVLSNLFAQRMIEKRYLAVVEGNFSKDNKPVTINTAIEGREAISHIRPQQYNPSLNRSFVEVHIETGRKHQIRRHLSEAGHSIIGDRLYGNSTKEHTQNLQLCCYFLSFTCPLSSKPISIKLPDELLPTFE